MQTISIKSGIKGVTFKSMNKGENSYWQARIQGRVKALKYFPFSDLGKEMAAKWYQKKIEENKSSYYQYVKKEK